MLLSLSSIYLSFSALSPHYLSLLLLPLPTTRCLHHQNHYLLRALDGLASIFTDLFPLLSDKLINNDGFLPSADCHYHPIHYQSLSSTHTSLSLSSSSLSGRYLPLTEHHHHRHFHAYRPHYQLPQHLRAIIICRSPSHARHNHNRQRHYPPRPYCVSGASSPPPLRRCIPILFIIIHMVLIFP